jgi:exonuclease III
LNKTRKEAMVGDARRDAPRLTREAEMRMLSWNIKWGGCERVPAILDRIGGHRPEIAIITEYKQDSSGTALTTGLHALGLSHIRESGPAAGRLGVLIASRHPLQPSTLLSGGENLDPWHLVDGAVGGVRVLGAYLPWDDRKIPYWTMVHTYAEANRNRPTVLIGDFNTAGYAVDGSGEALKQGASMRHLEVLGFYDAWRTANPEGHEFTWGARVEGSQRLDYAFVSEAVDKRRVRASHSHRERWEGISDHSVLIVDIEPLQ